MRIWKGCIVEEQRDKTGVNEKGREKSGMQVVIPPGETEESRVVEMKRGIPGFEGVRCYSLRAWAEGTPFGILASLDEEGPSFIVVNPFLACPGYAPEIPEREVRFLGIEDPSETSLLTIVTLRQDSVDLTVNLRAPLVINLRLNLAAQVVLEDDRWPVRHFLVEAAQA